MNDVCKDFNRDEYVLKLPKRIGRTFSHCPNLIYETFKRSDCFKEISILRDLRSIKRLGFYIIINNKKILISHEDFLGITYDNFKQSVDEDVYAIINLQYSLDLHSEYLRILNDFGVPVLPWIYFKRPNFLDGSFSYDINRQHKYLFSGAFLFDSYRRNRLKYIDFFNSFEDKIYRIIEPNQEKYIDVLKNTKWGLCLKGGVKSKYDHFSNGKTSREVEFSSCGMPLALDFIPIYGFDFYPEKDYLYLPEIKEFSKMETSDVEYYSKRAKIMYGYFSSKKATNLFLNLVFNKEYQNYFYNVIIQNIKSAEIK